MNVVALSNSALTESQGTGYVVVNYARALSALGHEVRIFGPETFELWPTVRRARRWRIAVGMALHALRNRLHRGAGVILVHGAESWLVIVLLRVARTESLLVHQSNGLETLHQSNLERHAGRDTLSGRRRRWYQPRAQRLLALSFTRVDGLVLVSKAEYRYAAAAAYQTSERLLVIENPLPQSFLGQPLRAPRPRVIGWCGAWLWTKGTNLLVEAANELLSRHTDVVLQIAGVGDAEVRPEFHPELRTRIVVAPFIAKSELRAWYESVSILLMTSYSESFGLVAAEAMACGCAVVSTPTGFATDLRDGEEAIVASDFSALTLVEGADRLLEDDDLRQRVAAAGHRRVQELRWDDAARRMDAFLEHLREAPSRSGMQRPDPACGDRHAKP